MAFYEETSGEFIPYIAYNAKSDKWSLNVDKEKVPLKGDIAFAADFENLKTGWFLFSEGMAPNIALDKSFTEKAPQPSPKHKRGAKFLVYIKGDHPGVYEFSTAAKNVMKALSDLHDVFLAGKDANAGKIPVIKVGESVEVKSSFKNPDGSNGTATNYQPKFTIEKWIPRPAELDGVPAAQEQAKPAPVVQSSVGEF